MSKRGKKPKAIWAVGGGKGGTGKTFLASNMGIYLAKLGQRVLLVDADLGGANLHTCLGLTGFRSNLSDFLDAGQRDVTDFVEETDILNLYLLPGALDSPGIRPNMRDLERLKVALNGANVDYVIMDLGSGTSREVMDLFLAGDVGIYVTVPEPTSIENTYRFLKESLYWILMQGNSKRSFKNAVQRAFRSHDFRGVPQMLQRFIAEEPLSGKTLEACMRDFSVRLILNQVRCSEEIEVGFAIRSAIKKYFGVPVDFVGYVDFDDQVLQCVHMRKSLLRSFPESKAAKCIANLTNKLLTAGNLAFDFR